VGTYRDVEPDQTPRLCTGEIWKASEALSSGPLNCDFEVEPTLVAAERSG
jgi:hypothetical protein